MTAAPKAKTGRPLRGSERRKLFSVRVDAETMEAITAAMEATGKSRGEVIDHAVRLAGKRLCQ